MRRPCFSSGTLCLLALGLAAAPASAQRLGVGEPEEEYVRALAVAGLAHPAGSFLLRPLTLDAALAGGLAPSEHPWGEALALPRTAATLGGFDLMVHPVRARGFYNSAFAQGDNDGAVWQGKGLTTALDAGLTLRRGRFTATLRPTLAWAQNASFPLAEPTDQRSEYAYPWRRLDLPQRFGPDAYALVDPGQSEVRVRLGGAALSVGTQNLWWGPGVRNAILVSNNAAGFLHGALSTDEPVDVGIGSVEAQWLWGRLARSEWGTPEAEDRGRFITGAALTFTPRGLGLDGLTLGLARVFYAYVPDGGVGAGEYFLVFQSPEKKALVTPDNPDGDDERDQLFAGWLRWVLPESGFEAYLEWARNDHGWSMRDYLLQPGHAAAYTVGLQKATPLSGNRLFTLRAELSSLERPNHPGREVPTYYAHWLVAEGYTQRGQLIGAAVGQGGNVQFLGADLYADWGRVSGWFERRSRDKDAYFDRVAAGWSRIDPDVAFTFGGSALRLGRRMDVEAGVALTRELDRYFQTRDDVTNLWLTLTARWKPFQP